MSRQDFITQLHALGYQPFDHGDGRVSFSYVVKVGVRFYNMDIKLGFEIPNDFPSVPPSGPHISPQILPINTSTNIHPDGGIHASGPFGPEWEYWSRPFQTWNDTDRTVATYMGHIHKLFKQ